MTHLQQNLLKPPDSPFTDLLNPVASEVERVLGSLLKGGTHLQEVMRYSVLGGGKRFRAFLTVAFADLFQVHREQSYHAAAAVELVHAYSLIHDDLPSMDNAILRRGQPSCHAQFDEASAILAGDALVPLAFEVLSDPHMNADPQIRAEMVLVLAKSIGPQGIALGQMMDLGLEGPMNTMEQVMTLSSLKTGELMGCACELGAILGGASKGERKSIREYALKLGLAFQIVDDLLDCRGNPAVTGKPTGQDQNLNKTTFLSLLGVNSSKQKAVQFVQEALQALEGLPYELHSLHHAAYFALSRLQ